MNAAVEVRQVVAWLAVVRWTTCIALWVAMAAVWLLPGLDIPLRSIAPLLAVAAVMHTALEIVRRRRSDVPRWLAGVSNAADAALLTGLLDLTGGPFNPFLVMYAVYVWLGAVVWSPRWGALAAIVSAGGFAWLVVDHLQPGALEHHRLNDFPTHLFTMWLSGAAVAELVAWYVVRAREALAERQRLLDEARERAARSERLAALTTLAAGAAHELSTPLATIAVAARELERSAHRLPASSDLVDAIKDDARLIRTEVDRCHAILDGMSGRAGDRTTAVEHPVSAEAIAHLARSRLTAEQQQRLRIEMAANAGALEVETEAVVQALSSLLKNAFDASDAGDDVVLKVERRGLLLRFEVRDRGPGMSEEARRRAGEPFFTTKGPNGGLGLGLFLARSIAERAGGSLRFDDGVGTTAILEIPAGLAEAKA